MWGNISLILSDVSLATATLICTCSHSTLCYSSSKSLVATTYYSAVLCMMLRVFIVVVAFLDKQVGSLGYSI